MSTAISLPGRRDVLAASVAVGAISLIPTQLIAAPETNAIRPFRVNVPEAELADLRQAHRGDAVARAGDGRG